MNMDISTQSVSQDDGAAPTSLDTTAAPELVLPASLARPLADAPEGDVANLRRLGQAITGALRKAPHFLRLRGLAPTRERDVTVAIVKAISALPPVKSTKPAKVSFTRVMINPDKATTNGNATAYSRTSQPLSLHTDSSYKAAPHELVAFQMVQSDATGGDTLMMPVETILSHLDRETIQTLASPIFPFGKGKAPVFWQTGGRPQIRYYRSQIDSAVENGAPITPTALAAMDALDAVLDRADLQARFHLDPGDILFMDNTRALHGRTGFSDISDRLMYRIRIEAGCLA